MNDYDYDYEDDELASEEEETKDSWTISSWFISLLIHMTLLLILGLFAYTVTIEADRPAVRSVYLETPTIEEEKDERDLIEVDPTIIHTEVVTDEITIDTDFEIEIEEVETETTEDQDSSEGRDTAMSTSEMASNTAFMAIGVSGGSAGIFGRSKGGDKRTGQKAYGPIARDAQSALDAALRWLQMHQSPEGHWDSDAYFLNCTKGLKMEGGKDTNGADEALTGYALLCFLGAGYDHRSPSKYTKTVRAGVEWLLENQSEDGMFGKRNYEHPVCTMALAEAYAMTEDPRLRAPTQKAIDMIIARQAMKDDYGLGWDYTKPKLDRIDSSVCGWNVMALKSAKAGNFKIGESLVGSKNWLEQAWKATNPKWEELDDYGSSEFPYTWNASTNTVSKKHMSFVGALCCVFINDNKTMLYTLLNDMSEKWFETGKYKTNSYVLYYASLASYQGQNGHWKEKWGHPKTGFVPWLIDTQYKNDDCKDGTWPNPNEKWHGSDTSPVLHHVYKTLALEVAWRYLPIGHQ